MSFTEDVPVESSPEFAEAVDRKVREELEKAGLHQPTAEDLDRVVNGDYQSLDEYDAALRKEGFSRMSGYEQ